MHNDVAADEVSQTPSGEQKQEATWHDGEYRILKDESEIEVVAVRIGQRGRTQHGSEGVVAAAAKHCEDWVQVRLWYVLAPDPACTDEPSSRAQYCAMHGSYTLVGASVMDARIGTAERRQFVVHHVG